MHALARPAEPRANPLLDRSNHPSCRLIARFAQGASSAPVVAIVALDRHQQRILACEGCEPRIVGRHFPVDDAALMGQMSRSHAPARWSDVDREQPRLRSADPLVRRTGARAVLAVPIGLPGGPTLGGIVVADRVPRHWPDALVAVVSELATGLLLHLLGVPSRASAVARPDAEESSSGVALLALESIPDACLVVDGLWRIHYANAAAAQLLGATTEALLLADARRVLEPLGIDDLPSALDEARNAGTATIEWHDREGARWYEARAFPTDGGITLFVRDITERRRSLAELTFEAYHDPLTGLPNRRLIMDRLQVTLAQARRRDLTVGLLLLDLDRFKRVNDTWGHAAGDALLLELANRLRATLREEDTVGRLAGDEFIVVLPSISDVGDAVEVADRILAAMEPQLRVAGAEIPMSVSIGMTVSRAGDDQIGDLLARADSALYEAKRQGGGRFAVER